MAFKNQFNAYRDAKENEVTELDTKYGKLTEDTHMRVVNFQDTITLNVGRIVKDVEDIKL